MRDEDEERKKRLIRERGLSLIESVIYGAIYGDFEMQRKPDDFSSPERSMPPMPLIGNGNLQIYTQNAYNIFAASNLLEVQTYLFDYLKRFNPEKFKNKTLLVDFNLHMNFFEVLK